MNIGLTQTILYRKNQAYDSLEHNWYCYLKGHTLIPISNTMNQDFAALADSIDILIITGGVDYATRRAVELKLASEMMKRFKPVLGICHGALLMTEILDGKLGEDRSHLNTKHSILYSNKEIEVDSHHSNIILKPHADATVLAVDKDGHCEAWIDDNLAGIMWHPQRMEEPFLPIEIANKFQL